MKNNSKTIREGQTLIVLLIFILVAITIATTSVFIIITNAQSTSGTAQSIEAYYTAESGIENAILRLLRNISYSGEILQVSPTATAEITIVHDGNYIVTSRGRSGEYTRILQANLDYTGDILRVVSLQEIY